MATGTPTIPWDEVTQEAASYLRELIRIDTSNPPGNEEPAARFLGEVLQREGIPVQYYESAPGRLNLAARLQGDGRGKPFVLLSHTDVVPVQREFWQEDPFGGVVKDGVIWGRGALDMKGMGVMELLAVLLLKRTGAALNRDVVYLAVADEEAASQYGAEWLEREHPELLEADYVLNEGGYGHLQFLGHRGPVFACAPGEKGPLWLKLRAEGEPGHGSVPHRNNALERLVRALARVADWRRDLHVVPEMRRVFQTLREQAGLRDGEAGSLEALAERHAVVRAWLTDTVSITGCRSGVKHNVIPADAEATLDVRLLPDTDPERFVQRLRDVIDDPQVQVEVVYQSSTPTSSTQTALYDVIEAVTRERVEGALVLPLISTGFTDSRVFRKHGVPAYGFIPALLDASELATIHGHNERLSIENLAFGTQVLYEVVRRVCTA
ncbi:MAG TPA: M20/M25/M40 family metallo-hydrolase [Dehalococcoidia bacterium]